MLLILEIALTIAAWRRGWKALALLPIVLAFGAGFALPLFVGTEQAMAMADNLWFVDLGVAAVLGLMAAVGRETRPRPTITATPV
ncbi:MAG: hypothetical protein K6T86_13740 [Pirellulales bacterium]|jgi:hypothetical protein|nr:hypothetical protein [Pirellulales bacterium]